MGKNTTIAIGLVLLVLLVLWVTRGAQAMPLPAGGSKQPPPLDPTTPGTPSSPPSPATYKPAVAQALRPGDVTDFRRSDGSSAVPAPTEAGYVAPAPTKATITPTGAKTSSRYGWGAKV